MTSRLLDWIARNDTIESPLIPAATVVLVRDGAHGLETVLMRRNSTLSFAEGMWVFPGGRIDLADEPADGDQAAAAANAAVREAKEEADLDIDPSTLVHYAHWIPPPHAPKRFSTWFFVAPAPAGEVTVDRGEILEHAWWRPADALERASDRRIEILPPTWVSLFDLSDFDTTDELLATARHRGPQLYATRIVKTPDGPAAVWEPDAAYESGDAEAPGARHRLVMSDGPWRLERQVPSA